jgi:hypothetical protein
MPLKTAGPPLADPRKRRIFPVNGPRRVELAGRNSGENGRKWGEGRVFVRVYLGKWCFFDVF